MLTTTRSAAENGYCIHLPGARHPLLLQPSLDPLPSPPSADDNRFEGGFMERPAWELRPTTGVARFQSRGGPPPRALDLRVPADRKVVAITGGWLALVHRAGCRTSLGALRCLVRVTPLLL